MAEGHGRQQWMHTSVLCALIANAHRDAKRGRPFKPEDFNPYAKQDRREQAIHVTPETIGLLREAFVNADAHPAPGRQP
jgi:hypothetical protein